MRLKLGELQKVVERTLEEEKSVDLLRKEVSRALGPSVITDVRLDQLAEGANYRIDVLERTGREGQIDFRASVLSKFVNSKSVEARKLCARLLPESVVIGMQNDKNVAVRHIVARRMPRSAIVEMIRRSPQDDELRVILREKKLLETGLPKPKAVDEPFDMYGEEPLGDAVKQSSGPELSDMWYKEKAHKIIQDYGGNMEGQWEAPACHRYCASLKATSHVDVDEEKLFKEVQKQLEEKDDRTLERYSLKEVVKLLREGAVTEESMMPLFEETIDPVAELLEASISASEYVNRGMKVFSIREATMPKALRKFRVTEGHTTDVRIPCIGQVPGHGEISPLAERALDTFVKSWNQVQADHGEPIKIDWSPNPNAVGRISFQVELK